MDRPDGVADVELLWPTRLTPVALLGNCTPYKKRYSPGSVMFTVPTNVHEDVGTSTAVKFWFVRSVFIFVKVVFYEERIIMTHFVQIIIAILGSTAVATLIQFFVTRRDNRIGIAKRLDKLEKDGLRTQLLLLILMRPAETKEILTLGEHYFKDLEGNWYMTSIFNKWVEDAGVAEPEWFEGGKK